MFYNLPAAWLASDRPKVEEQSFQGTLIHDKQDGVQTLYRRNRSYDPQTGRFTQEDPIGLAGGMNLYGFAGGDPVNFSDPFGLCPDGDPLCEIAKVVNARMAPIRRPLEIAAMVVTAPLTIEADAGIAVLGLGSKASTFYRGVSAAEAADVAATGGFRAGAAAAGNEGKYLTNSIDAAAAWGAAAAKGGGGQVLKVSVPADAVRLFSPLGRIDGIGQAWHAPIAALKGAKVEAVANILKEIPR
jgi:RHS repeat-associated protein